MLLFSGNQLRLLLRHLLPLPDTESGFDAHVERRVSRQWIDNTRLGWVKSMDWIGILYGICLWSINTDCYFYCQMS